MDVVKFRNHGALLWRPIQCMTAALLALLLLATPFAGMAYAEDSKVTGIEFDYDPADFNNSTSSLDLLVEEDTVYLAVLASLSDSSTKNNVTSDVTWKSSNTSYVKVDKGELTGVGKGTATISATYKGYTITIKASSDYVYDSVTLMENDVKAPDKATIELGQPLVYKLNGSKNGTIEDVTSEAAWTTSNSSIATVDEGVVTLKGTGTVTITAKLKGKSDSISVTVSSPYKSIAISPEQLLELEIGTDDQVLQATVEPKLGGSIDVTKEAKWTSANTKIATVDKGIVSPVSAGKTTITVSHMGVTSSIEVVVRTAYQSIRLSPEKEYHMSLQDSPLQITAEVLHNSNTTMSVTSIAEWSSSNVVVATVAGGIVTPKAVGSTRITASYKGVSRSIEVTVYPSVSKLSLDVETIDGFDGGSGELPAVMGRTFDGSMIDVSKLVTWTSKDEKTAVIKDGKWTAKEIGETVLTAKLRNYEVDVKLNIHVKPLKLIAGVKDMSLVIGKETAYPSVTVINADGEEEDVSKAVKWTASSDNVVLKANTIKGLDASVVTLTATYLNKTAVVKVRVEEEIVRIVADPAIIELNPNKSKSIKATGYYKDGRSVALSTKIVWTVSSPALASVNGRTVKALNVGTGIVSGSYQGIKVELPVIVTPKLKSITPSDKSLTLSAGAKFKVQLTANYTTGNAVNATDAAVWTTSKASVATVKNGEITAVGKGTASIKATYEGKSVTIRVTVK